jgi:hypothetical protein
MDDRGYKILNFQGQAALTNYEIEITGSNIIYLAGNIQVDIKLDYNTSDAISLFMGKYIPVPFKRFFITTATKGNFKLLVTKPRDFTIQSFYYDKDLITSLKGQSFFCGGSGAAGVGNYSFVGLYNPSGSGILASINKLYAVVNNASVYINLRRHNAAVGAPSADISNKVLYGAGPKCVCYTGNAGIFGDEIGFVWHYQATMGFPVPNDFKNPFLLKEGCGLYIQSPVLNIQILASMEWDEI